MKINRIDPRKHKYFALLGDIPNPPARLHVLGTLLGERRPTVAIVGTRKPTSYGKEVTQMIATELAKRGVVIVSGLALGVDGIAHRAALDAGGTTIAVLANGLPRIYPATHKSLADDIVKRGGAILSEYEPETDARSYQFLERNRLVSGLADAVIVTEAATRSGTLSTVSHALAQGREVFVVPGNITSPLSAGCNELIKQGAHPLTSYKDVLEIIAPDLLEGQSVLPLGSTPLETTIISLIQSGIHDGDTLQQQTATPASEFTTALTMMEIDGTIRALGGNQWTLR